MVTAQTSIADAPLTQTFERQAEVPASCHGLRLDAAAAKLFDEFSRERLKSWIVEGALRVNGEVVDKPRTLVALGDVLLLAAEMPLDPGQVRPQNLPLTVVFADEHLAIIEKPAGLTVHPGAGSPDSTLMNALLYHFPQTVMVPRAGIVHRLDKDTSGLLVVALSLPAHARLVAMIGAREMRREYDAVVAGVLSGGGRVDAPIGRHPHDRVRMAVTDKGRPAVSHYRVQERFRFHSHLRVRLETGRTHQIRVHMAHIRHPIVGDATYAPVGVRGVGLDPALRAQIGAFPRQALHARELGFEHPITGEALQWVCEPPPDMRELMEALRADLQNDPPTARA